MSIIKKSGLIAVIILMLTSCSMFSPVNTGPQTIFVLSSVPHVAKRAGNNKTLIVSPVGSEIIYNTSQMAYSKHPYEISYFAKNGWAARPSDMLYPLIVQTLQNSHYYHAVVSNTAGVQADYLLTTQILKMQQEFSPQSCVSYYHVKLRTQLINIATNHVIATRTFSSVVEAPYNNPYGGVVAANSAVATVLKQLTQFCLRHS